MEREGHAGDDDNDDDYEEDNDNREMTMMGEQYGDGNGVGMMMMVMVIGKVVLMMMNPNRLSVHLLSQFINLLNLIILR